MQQSATNDDIWHPTINQTRLVDELLRVFYVVKDKITGKPKRQKVTIPYAASQIGINRTTAWRYFDNPHFIEYFNIRRLKAQKEKGAFVDECLMKSIGNLDVQAIKLYYEKYEGLKDRIQIENISGLSEEEIETIENMDNDELDKYYKALIKGYEIGRKEKIPSKDVSHKKEVRKKKTTANKSG